MKKLVPTIGLLVLLILDGPSAWSLPSFAARTGSKCISCHVNPSGGGMRKLFGAEFGRKELPVPEWSQETDLSDFTNLLNNVLGVGADFRTLYLVRQAPDSSGTASTTENEFWQMQGDLYLNFRVAKSVQLYLKKGLYSGFEAYGLLHVLPQNGHLKIGKFVPNYGLRLDDHTSYIRRYTGFSPETGRPELTGLEAGIAPGPTAVTVGLFNGADGYGGSAGSKKMVLGRAEGIFDLGDVYLGLGGNVLNKDLQDGTTELLYGGFGSISIGDLALLGEVDLHRVSRAASKTTSLLVYGGATFVLTQGFELVASYDFIDPDKDYQTGTLARYSIGFEFFPLSGVEVRPLYRIVQEDPIKLSNNEFHLLFHIYL